MLFLLSNKQRQSTEVKMSRLKAKMPRLKSRLN